jgi:hypothetical protein
MLFLIAAWPYLLKIPRIDASYWLHSHCQSNLGIDVICCSWNWFILWRTLLCFVLTLLCRKIHWLAVHFIAVLFWFEEEHFSVSNESKVKRFIFWWLFLCAIYSIDGQHCHCFHFVTDSLLWWSWDPTTHHVQNTAWFTFSSSRQQPEIYQDEVKVQRSKITRCLKTRDWSIATIVQSWNSKRFPMILLTSIIVELSIWY